MSIFVGLRLADEDLDMIADWLQRCGDYHDFPLGRPIHRDHISIPLAYSGGEKMDDFEPLGSVDKVINFANPGIRWIGERGTVILGFQDTYVKNRMVQLFASGFRRRGKIRCRLPMSIHSQFLDASTYLKLLPKRSVRIVEEFTIPFDTSFGKYAHLPKPEEVESPFALHLSEQVAI